MKKRHCGAIFSRLAVLAGVLGLLLLMRAGAEVEALQPTLAPALLGAVVVIDPGHGGPDPGMVGQGADGEIWEKDINLAVAEALAEYCRSAGAIVRLTREQDTDLAETKRADLEARVAVASTADIFISLHCNSFVTDPGQNGAQVFYGAGNEGGMVLAEKLQAALAEETGTPRTPLPHAESFLLKNLTLPAVIVELGFLSNPTDLEQLTDRSYQWRLAECLFSGLVSYLAVREDSMN